ncbi:MAG: hypothetical protein HQK76_15790 [Desulfobacterales bacterium]|nr:hypothetical protein [Desulfobacterales bacterium]
MKEEALEKNKATILKAITDAGAKGLKKTALKITPQKNLNQAIKELEKEQKIGNLETGNKSLFVLKEFDSPLEMACDIIEKKILSSKKVLFSKTKLVKDCSKGIPGKVKKQIDNAINWMIKENKFYKEKAGASIFLIYIPSLPCLTSNIPKLEEKNYNTLNRDKVINAYNALKKETGFSNVEIYSLLQKTEVSMDSLKEFLLEESRQKRAVLSMGDWSLSSEEVRSCAIYINDKPHLLVRFKN